VPAVLIIGIALAIPSAFQSSYSYWPGTTAGVISVIFGLLSCVVGIFVSIAGVKIGLGFVDRKPSDFADLYSGYTYFWKMLGTGILYFLIVLAGTILLIIPGIYWAVRYRFSMYAVIDEGLGPVDAIKRSGQLTRGVWWHLFLFYLVMIGINIIGTCLCIIGLLFAIPVMIVAEAYIFRSLKGQIAVGVPVQAPAPVAEA
jgi:uncharacterized membrane protein